MLSESAVQRRARPRIIILDDACEAVFADTRDGEEVRRKFLDAARRLVREGAESLQLVVEGTNYVVGIAALNAPFSMRYALLIEPRGSRDPLTDAIARFGFTPREVEVLALIVEGTSNKEIARTLCIAEGTVQDHVRNLCAKSGAKRRGDLLAGVFGADAQWRLERPAQQRRDHSRLRPRPGLGPQTLEVVPDGQLRDFESIGDLRGGHAADQQGENLPLALGELEPTPRSPDGIPYGKRPERRHDEASRRS